MKHINSHNLNDGDIIICTKDKMSNNGNVYFSKGSRYSITMFNLYQSKYNEIFMRCLDVKLKMLISIHYIFDSEFKQYFKLDIKLNRKLKLNNIYNIKS